MVQRDVTHSCSAVIGAQLLSLMLSAPQRSGENPSIGPIVPYALSTMISSRFLQALILERSTKMCYQNIDQNNAKRVSSLGSTVQNAPAMPLCYYTRPTFKIRKIRDGEHKVHVVSYRLIPEFRLSGVVSGEEKPLLEAYNIVQYHAYPVFPKCVSSQVCASHCSFSVYSATMHTTDRRSGNCEPVGGRN